MEIRTTSKWLPVYEALASDVRLGIINLLAEKPMNIRELAQNLGLSSAIMTMHVRKLETAGIIRTEMVPHKRGVQKVCSLALNSLSIVFPSSKQTERRYHEVSVPVGHYTDFEVTPTCGIATREKVIGLFDDPRCFLDPERMNAGILWFTQGYVEYKVANYLLATERPEEIEVAMELSSEAPGVNEKWPSDISFYINGVYLGQWTSPGDFGERRGELNPAYWSNRVNQHGVLKVLRVNADGSFIDGKQISDVDLSKLDLQRSQWTLRLAVRPESEHVGGLTIFGKGFGNYDQDIEFRVYYSV